MIRNFYAFTQRVLLSCKKLPVISGIFFLLISTSVNAQLATNYNFNVSNVAYTPLAGTTLLIPGTDGSTVGTFNDNFVSPVINIGFNFQFDCVAYTQFSVTPSGYLVLGGTAPANVNFANDLTTSANYPIIAPWWDHQHLYDGGGAGAGCSFTPPIGVHYVLTGSAPNRILKIEFNTQVVDNTNAYWWGGCGLTMNRYQAWLYEGTNNIEFRYGSMWTASAQPTSGTIGIGNAAANFISVTPNGGAATTSSIVSNNNIALHLNNINTGSVYTFSPCYIRRTGNGTQAPVSMAPGDNLFTTTTVSVGSSGNFTPFTLNFPAACATHNYILTISGPSASEYKWGATNNQVTAGSMAGGSSLTPVIIFSPTAAGVRNAVLTINDVTAGCSVVFNLQASGCVAPTVTQSPASICPGGVQQINVLGGAPVTFTSLGVIAIPNPPATGSAAGDPASPYPSNLVVSGLPAGAMVKSVSINGISHTFPDDIDMVLQSPTGVNVILMSDCGGTNDFINDNLVFDDNFPAMSDNGANPSGTYKPTNFVTPDVWPAPGPGSLTQANPTLGSFIGNPNGTWKLFIVDDLGGDIGAINTGWSITFSLPGSAVFNPTTGLFTDPAATIPYTGTSIGTVYASPAGTSSYIVTDPTCPGSPAIITVTVNPLTVITSQPANSSTICAGSGTTFSVTATGTAPLTYQWQVSTDGGGTWTNLTNVAPYSNVTTATMTVNPVTAAMNGNQYRCVVTGGCSVATSNAGILTVDQISHVSVTATPSSACAPPTASTTITGTVTGGNLSAGIGVLGSSGTINLAITDNTTVTSSITLPTGTTITSFNQLKVRLNIGHSWVGDLKITLTAPCGNTIIFDRPGVPATTIGNSDNLGTTNAASPPAPPSAIYTFDVAGATIIPELANGTTGFIASGVYQPSESSNPGVAHNWAGLTFPCNGAGTWTLSIQDNAGGDIGNLTDWAILGPTSGNYTHTLTGPGTITQNPSTGTNNSTGNFSVSGLPVGTHNFTFTSTDVLGCSVSTPVTMTVNPIPVVTITPASAAICPGGIQQLTASAPSSQTFSSGTLNLDIPDNTPAGITTPAIVLPALTITNATDLKVSINARHSWVGDLKFTLISPCGTTFLFDRPGVPPSTVGNLDNLGTSNASTPPPAVYTFDLGAAIVIPELANGTTGFIAAGSYKPSDVNGAAHNWAGLGFPCSAAGNWTLNISDNASGDLGRLVDWSISYNASNPVVFTQTSPLPPPNTMFADAGAAIPYTGTLVNTIWVKPTVTTTYTATATIGGCTGSSNVTVTVNQVPTITTQPTPATQLICPGFTVSYTVVATGTGLTYQWRRNTVNLVNGGFISGATSPTLTISNVSAADAGNYDVVVSGTCPPAATSNTVVLNVATTPTITTQPANVTVCQNANATFSVVVAGTPTPNIFQWQVSTDGGATWTNLTTGGSYTTTLTLTSVTLAMNGNRYRVIVTNSCGQTITSSVATLTVNPIPVVIATDLFNQRVCLSDTLIPLVGSPVGGSWTGIGVSGFNFIPTSTAVGTYILTYTYTNSFGCTISDTTSVKVVSCPERIRLLRDDAVLLYPNPNNGHFNIRMNSTLYNYLGMRVYDMTGRLLTGSFVKNTATNHEVQSDPTFTGLVYGRIVPIDLSKLPAGTYLVRFYYDDGIRTSDKGFLVVIQK